MMTPPRRRPRAARPDPCTARPIAQEVSGRHRPALPRCPTLRRARHWDMPSALPDGEPVPAAGPLPPGVRATGPLGLYVHVPFCTTRCGYCDFNTYTGLGQLHASWADSACAEVRLARRQLGAVPVGTVFFGGGDAHRAATGRPGAGADRGRPVLRPARGRGGDDRGQPGLGHPGACSQRCVTGGFTRVSFGMQSAAPHVLQVLERTHTPGRPQAAVREAYAAGFEQVSLDLIYGTPGESDEDFRCSLAAAREAGPTHVSAYALVVEPGRTALARRVASGAARRAGRRPAGRPLPARRAGAGRPGLVRGEQLGCALPAQPGLLAGRRLVGASGRGRTATWAGCGGGTSSTRWRGPRRSRRAGRPPPAGRCSARTTDGSSRCCWGCGCARGCRWRCCAPAGRCAADRQVDEGLLEPGPYGEGRAVLTLLGRLLADAVVRDLVD